MLPGHTTKTNLGVFVGLAACAVIYYEPLGALPAIYTYFLAGFGILAQGWGCYNYVTGKGKAPALALIGVVPLALFLSGVIPGFHPPAFFVILLPIGLLILVLLPDSNVDRRPDWRSELAARRGTEPRVEKRRGSSMEGAIAVAVMLALALGGWYYYRQHLPVSEQEARKLAVERYPALGVRDSALNREFLARYNRLQTTNKDYFKDASWPLKLAAESQAAVDQSQGKR